MTNYINTTIITDLDALAVGRTSSNPFVDVFSSRDPTPQDINYPIQKKWLNTVDNTFWELEALPGVSGITTAVWVKIGSASLTESLTGNSGGPVFPDGSNNINVVGDGTYITTVGTPLTNTLTIIPGTGLPTIFVEDAGTASALLNRINVFGGIGIKTVGSGNTITINATGFAFHYTNVVGPITYTVLTTDYYISCDPTAGAITLNFPNSPGTNQLWVVKDRTGQASTNNITLTTPGGTDTFDGLTSYVMATNYGSRNLLANGSSNYEVW